MEQRRDEGTLVAELRAARPRPRPRFAAELDGRAAAGFPPRDPLGRLRRALSDRVGAIPPLQALASAAAVMLLALVVATAAVRLSEGGGSPVESIPAPAGRPEVSPPRAHPVEPSAGAESASGVQFSQAPAPGVAQRKVERGAQLVLRAPADEVSQDARRVFDAVHAAHGIVLSSSVNAWEHGRTASHRASASFELLVPSPRLDDTVAALSRIADVRSRHDSTADITAATRGVASRLREVRARIDGLLSELASAETEAERSVIEARLRRERRLARSLGAGLGRLHRRADYSHLSLRIESGGEAGSGGASWGLDDALRDALGVLSTAAGVTLLVLVVIAPIVALGLLAMIGRRGWARRARERALG